MKKLLMIILLAGFAMAHTPVKAKDDNFKMDEFSDEFSEADQAELEKLIAELEQEAGTMPAGEEEADVEEPAAKRQKTEKVDHVEW